MRRLTFISLLTLAFVIPLENMFVLPGVGALGRLVGIICFLCALLAVLIERKSHPFGPFQFAFGLFLLWAMITFYWSIDQKQTLTSIVTFTQLFVLILLIWEFIQSEKQQLALMNAYVLGAYISLAGVVSSFLEGSQYQYLRYSASGFNPNDIGLILVLGVPLAWRLSLEDKHVAIKWLYRMYAPAALVAISLTASRASFLAYIVALLFIFWTYSNLSLKSKITVALIFIFLGSSLFFVVPERSLSRFTSIGDELLYGSLNQRTLIWTAGLEVFADAPVLGTGAGTFRQSVAMKIGRGMSSHNMFLSTLVGQGVVGFLVLLSMLGILLTSILNMQMLEKKLWIVMLATWFVGVMTLDWEQEKITWFLLGLMACQGRAKETAAEDTSLSGVLIRDGHVDTS